jgi:hypothetical protein
MLVMIGFLDEEITLHVFLSKNDDYICINPVSLDNHLLSLAFLFAEENKLLQKFT